MFYFIALFVILLNFLPQHVPKFLQHIAFCRIKAFKREKVEFVHTDILGFLQIYVFYHCKTKNWSFRFPWETSPDEIFTTSVSNFNNLTKGNLRKFTVSFAFGAHFDVIKYQKTLMFSLGCMHITWAFVLSTHVIIKKI